MEVYLLDALPWIIVAVNDRRPVLTLGDRGLYIEGIICLDAVAAQLLQICFAQLMIVKISSSQGNFHVQVCACRFSIFALIIKILTLAVFIANLDTVDVIIMRIHAGKVVHCAIGKVNLIHTLKHHRMVTAHGYDLHGKRCIHGRICTHIVIRIVFIMRSAIDMISISNCFVIASGNIHDLHGKQGIFQSIHSNCLSLRNNRCIGQQADKRHRCHQQHQ